MKKVLFFAVMMLILSCSSDDNNNVQETATVTYKVSANENILHTARISRIGSEGVSLGSPQPEVVLPWEETIINFAHVPQLSASNVTAHNGDAVTDLLIEIYYNGELKESGTCDYQGCGVHIIYNPN